ncbi:MAG: MG2 domain-containing protein [Kofleriaceae bacterium]
MLVCAALAACGGGTKAKGDLSVAGTPAGEVTGQMRVVLAFSRPMVLKNMIGQPIAKPPLTLNPPIAGNATWTDEKTLAFVPSANLPLSTKYAVTVPGETKALDGADLGTPTTFEFFTERLRATADVLGLKERATKDQIVRLDFTQEVAFDQVTQNCSFESGPNKHKVKAAKDSATGTARTFTVQPTGELTLESEWTITCRAGLKGVVGNLGLAEAATEKFKTYGKLAFVGLTPDGNDIVPDEDLSLEIAFSNPLAEPYAMKLEPKAPGFPQRCHDGATPAGVSCNVQLDPLTSYTLTIDATQKDVFGQTLGKAETIEFRTTDAQPTISMESGYFVAELSRPVIPIWTRNVTKLDVTAVDVTPANMHLVAGLLDWWEPKPADLKAAKLTGKSKTIPITGPKNKWGQHSLGAQELFGTAPGPGMYYVEVGSKEVARDPYADGGRQKVLVNFTDIGLVSKLSPSRGLVWASKLSTGKPLPGATITVRDPQGKVTFTGTTDANGVAVLPPTNKISGKPTVSEEEENDWSSDESGIRIYASLGNDWTMINPSRSGGLAAWNFNVSTDNSVGAQKLRGFMHTDRGLYRPGEKVHIKGIARVSKLGEPLSTPAAGGKVAVEITGPQGKQFSEATAKLSAFGGFWLDVDLPADARLGDYTIRATVGDLGTFTREFSVEEYRVATFEVSGKLKEPRIVHRGKVAATINASYLYGAPLRSGDVNVTIHSRKRRVDFEKELAEFQFSDDRRYDSYYYDESDYSQQLVTEDKLTLDDKGNATLAVAISPTDVYQDSDLLVRAAVTSPSNEVIAKSFTVPYFKYKRYLGVKSEGYFLDVKKPTKIKVVGASPDGKMLDGAAKVTITRRDWNCVWEDWGYRGSYSCNDKVETLFDKVVTLTAGKPTDVDFTPDKDGDYLVLVESATEKEKDETAIAALQIYAWGGEGGSWRSSDSLSFDVVADKKEYKAGDTATLILKTDLAQATGLVTIERDGVIEQRLIDVTAKTKSLAIPITEAMAPNVYVSVALVQGRSGEGPRGKPRMRMGIVNLPVRPADNKLTVSIQTDKPDYRPGAAVTATVKVVDKDGKPVSAEVSITAADEGVLSLIGYETPNPIPTFFAPWGIGTTTATQYEYIRDIPGPNLERPATGGDAPGTMRSRFVSTAVWAPGALTDANGVATVKFNAPDNLTAFRLMAVAADKTYKFGSSDKRFTVSKPLQLMNALPRFLAIGDKVRGGVIVHNETGGAGTATVKLVGENVSLTGPLEQTIQLAKGARTPVLFEIPAKEIGTAKLRFSVTMNSESDAVEFSLPVIHPSPVYTDHVGHAAVTADTKVAVSVPADAEPGSVQLAISVDPDGLAGIEDSLRGLVGYPYGCLEQTTSKVIPMIAVRDLAESLAIDGLAGPKLEGFVKAGIAKIGRHQTAYGGFSLWPGGSPEAYYTAYALWGLSLAQKAGYDVDQQRILDGLEYLRNDGKNPDTSRSWYSESGNLGNQAFALYVRAALGDKDTQSATTLLANPKLPVYGKAYVARAIAAGTNAKDPAVVKLVGELSALAAAAAKSDAMIEEPDEKDMGWYMSSPLRTTSMVLHALVELDGKNPSIPGLVRAIMKDRRKQRYIDTQSNLYSLLALSAYAKGNAANTPSVNVALDGQQVISGQLAGKQRMRVATIPLAKAGELTFAPKGEVSYSVDLKYRRKPDALKFENKGLGITREYLDEKGVPKASFTVGDVVVVRLSLQLNDDVNHIMVSDAIPAAFEPLNTRLATTGDAGVKQTESWGIYREMRDDQVNFTNEWSSNGKYVYEYTMRATSVGTFARPPAITELMYDPAVRGQTAADVIEVKAK